MPQLNILDLLFAGGQKPINSVTDIPKSPPTAEFIGQVGSNPYVGEVGPNPMAAPQQPAPEQQRALTLNQIFGLDKAAQRAQPPAPAPGDNLPVAPKTPPGGAAPLEGEVLAPSAAPPASRSRSDGRDMLRATARALIQNGSPAQKVQGVQMLFEANQPTPEERAEAERTRKAAEETAERQRLIQALDEDPTMDPAMKARARMAIQLGAKPEDVLKMATGDEKVTERGDKAKQAAKERQEALTRYQMSSFANAQSAGAMEVAAEEAVQLIDNGTMTTGMGGKIGQYFPGSDANALVTALAPIQANIGFDRLQQMRDASKTGGALGSIAVRELEFLQSVQGSLDPLNVPPDRLKANIMSVVKGKQLLSELHDLVPLLDAGDPEAHAKARELAKQVGTIAHKVHASVRSKESKAKGDSSEQPTQKPQAAAPIDMPDISDPSQVPGAQRGPDGKYYVIQNGKRYRVEQ